MALNKIKGNMYSFLDATWNPISGRCIHNCVYCSCRRYWNMMEKNKVGSSKLQLKELYLTDNLGTNNSIFVGSSTDMFANNVPVEWIDKVIDYCYNNPSNKYLFQSKNPYKMLYCALNMQMPFHMVFATTIETNKEELIKQYSNVPIMPKMRADVMLELKNLNYETQITIEPIMDFNVKELLQLVTLAQPNILVIGADSKNNKLPEPSAEKLGEFTELLYSSLKNTEIIFKDNLQRLYMG